MVKGIFSIIKLNKNTGVKRCFNFESREQLKRFVKEHTHSYKFIEAYSINEDYEMENIEI